MVDQGANAHNVLWYHRDAIDAGLAMADSALVRVHADALIAFIEKDNLPWAQFFADRGHALADVIDGQGDGVALSSAHALGRRLSLNIGLPAIEAAQAQLN
ncbi:MAG: hypothetical protein OSB82_11470 [Alphaproteobacteria bacterium]|nr:hypothetical protein [Alphaproteobacteria bacterium]